MAAASSDPVLDALDGAPLGDEDLSQDELRELDRRAADLASGLSVGVPHAEVQRGLEGLRRRAG